MPRKKVSILMNEVEEGRINPEPGELESSLVRVSKRPDSSVPQTRGYGRQDEPPPTAS